MNTGAFLLLQFDNGNFIPTSARLKSHGTGEFFRFQSQTISSKKSFNSSKHSRAPSTDAILFCIRSPRSLSCISSRRLAKERCWLLGTTAQKGYSHPISPSPNTHRSCTREMGHSIYQPQLFNYFILFLYLPCYCRDYKVDRAGIDSIAYQICTQISMVSI